MKTQSSNQSRMFRSIVLMGSGLALGCGGKAGVDGPAGGAPGTAGNPGAAGNGAAGASSGAGGTASAGSPSFAGGGFGGAVAGMAGTAGGPDCPPTQWTCSVPVPCDGNTSWAENHCRCDAKRPAKSSDCAATQSFVCVGSNSTAEAGLQGVECSCVAKADSCTAGCRAAISQYADYYDCDDHSLPDTTLCGCAVVLLK